MVTSKIHAKERKFKNFLDTLCGKILSHSLKERLYKACIRSVMRYRAESWAIKNVDTRQMQTTEMTSIEIICGKTLLDQIRGQMLRILKNISKGIV